MDSFDEIYDEHVWRVYGFLAYRVGSREDAEDLTQQTFERALRAWDRFDIRKATPGTWLITIARNLMIDHFRATGSRPATGPIDEVPEGLLPTAAGPQDDLGLDPRLAGAIAELGDREREILALRFGGDLTGPEIAEVTGLTLANVQQILSRTLRGLREELGSP